MRKLRILCVAAHVMNMLALQADTTVTIESLLKDMVDRDAVGRFPSPDFRLKQDSSYNRASVSPDDEKGWFENADFNVGEKQQGRYIRIEENEGRQEWVLMESDTPGVITRSWWPINYLDEDTVIRFYLDGETTPALEGHPLTLFQGKGLIPYPLAHSSHLSAVNFFPIPYAGSCKVTLSKMPFFFIFTYREYAEGTQVKSFTMDDFEAAKALTRKTCQTLLNPTPSRAGNPTGFSATLANKEEKSLDLPSGVGAVRELSVKLGDYANPEVTRTVVLKMEFDGKETVWCPIGDFFGSGIGLNPFQGWYRTVAQDGVMTCRWVMPYRTGGKVSLVNLGEEPVDLELKVKTGDWSWDDRSMLFHAMWRGQYPTPTRPRSDWNYVTTKGRGVYVGDTLTVMNPVEKWWGEGDAKIWVDGEDFPSIFGTGTEDYYGYAWGGKMTDFYEHPFHAQVFSHKYNKLNRKPKAIIGKRNTQGYNTETRTRALDTMPFAQSIQVDMEIWAFAEQPMGYQVGTYWYADPGTTSNRKPEPEEILNVPPLPDMSATDSAQKPAKPNDIKNAIDFELKMVTSKSGKIREKEQGLKQYKGVWNESDHILFRDARIEDHVELRIPAPSPALQKIALHATRSFDFGTVRVTVNGEAAGGDLDLYANKPIPSGAVSLGTFAPVDNSFLIRIEVVGKNPQSKGALFGLDCVSLVEAE
ncbi:MAG: glycoside hydrolase family 172 protein [Verrucomicrobiaceae bacterium]